MDSLTSILYILYQQPRSNAQLEKCCLVSSDRLRERISYAKKYKMVELIGSNFHITDIGKKELGNHLYKIHLNDAYYITRKNHSIEYKLESEEPPVIMANEPGTLLFADNINIANDKAKLIYGSNYEVNIIER